MFAKIITSFALVFMMLGASVVEAKDVYVNGYTRRDGTYVQPHHRTAPDSNPFNNYSAKGNVNPYTGKEGTKDPYAGDSPRDSSPYSGLGTPKPTPDSSRETLFGSTLYGTPPTSPRRSLYGE
jgi:hypothetical protein